MAIASPFIITLFCLSLPPLLLFDNKLSFLLFASDDCCTIPSTWHNQDEIPLLQMTFKLEFVLLPLSLEAMILFPSIHINIKIMDNILESAKAFLNVTFSSKN
jgi:hypothetical protein